MTRRYLNALLELWLGYLYIVPMAFAILVAITMPTLPDTPLWASLTFAIVGLIATAVGFLAPLLDV